MPNRLPIPPELASLIEKRDQAERRRLSRRKKERTEESASALVNAPDATAPTALKTVRPGPKSPPVRRSSVDRRQAKRRRSDKHKSKS